MLTCSICGFQQPAATPYCPGCGKAMQPAAAPPVAAAVPPASTASGPGTLPANRPALRAAPARRGPALGEGAGGTVAGALFLLALVGIGAYFLFPAAFPAAVREGRAIPPLLQRLAPTAAPTPGLPADDLAYMDGVSPVVSDGLAALVTIHDLGQAAAANLALILTPAWVQQENQALGRLQAAADALARPRTVPPDMQHVDALWRQVAADEHAYIQADIQAEDAAQAFQRCPYCETAAQDALMGQEVDAETTAHDRMVADITLAGNASSAIKVRYGLPATTVPTR